MQVPETMAAAKKVSDHVNVNGRFQHWVTWRPVRAQASIMKTAFASCGWSVSNLTRYSVNDYRFQATEKRPAGDDPGTICSREALGQAIGVRVTA